LREIDLSFKKLVQSLRLPFYLTGPPSILQPEFENYINDDPVDILLLVFLGRGAALGWFWSGTKDTTDFGVLSGVALGSSVSVEKEVITPPKTETATPDKSVQDKSATPVPDTINSPSKTANNTDEPKATPDKTPKSVGSLVPDQNQPKAAPRPRNTSSRV
jgi:hypothetical protein